MKRFPIVSALAIVAFASPAGAQSIQGRVEGDVYVVTVSGDVKKAAGSTVGLLPAKTVNAVWRQACAEYNAFWRAKVKQARELLRDSALTGVHQTEIEREQSAALLTRMKEANVATMIKAGRHVSTGMAAHYRFSNVPAGEYLLVSSMRLGNKLLTWTVPITVRRSQTTIVDLDSNNVEEDAPSCGASILEN